MMILQIEYMNGTKEEVYVDEYNTSDKSLNYYIRFGEDAGSYGIPLYSIKKWREVK